MNLDVFEQLVNPDALERLVNLDALERLLAQRSRRTLAIPDFRSAAVLVAVTTGTQPELILTRRSATLPTHRGQIAFPGGKLEAGEDAVQAGLREAFEEVALEPSAVRVLGLMHDVWTPQGFQVTPVLASIAPNATLEPQAGEVAALLRVPIADLRQITPRLDLHLEPPQGRWPAGVTGPRTILHYDWRGVDIWGMTAFVIEELLTLLDQVQ